MQTPLTPDRALSGNSRLLWVYPALVLPSLYIVQKFIGSAVAVSYACVAALLVLFLPQIPVPRTQRQERLLAFVLFAVLVITFVSLYPRVNVHVPMQGSDDDDAYNIGARALVAARSPYGERTYLGNVLHQFAGAFIIAMPFVALGTSALQNLFWIPLFFVVARKVSSRGRAVQLAALTVVASPVVLHQVATGTGHITNTLFVALGLWWLVTTTRRRDAASIAWGVALASRANFLLLLPFGFAWINAASGTRAALRSAVLTGLTIALLTVPFYFASPQDFGPLEASNRLTRFDTAMPHAGAALLVGMTMLAIVLAWRTRTLAGLFKACAVVQAFPVLAGTILGIVGWRTLDLAYLGYFTFAAWFALMGWLLADRSGVPASAVEEALPGRR